MLAVARRLLRFRTLLGILTNRELKARYRGTVLGFIWSLVNPLLQVAIFTFVFGFVLPRGEGLEPYALYLIVGLFPWTWIAGSLLEGTMSLVTNAGLIRKAVFPAELLPVVAVLSNLVHFLLSLPILALALLTGRFLGYSVGGWTVILVPVVILLQLVVNSGIALGLSALHAHFKDVRDIVANLLTVLFWMAPIIYSLEWIPLAPIRTLVQLNPFTPFILAYQDLIFFARVPTSLHWAHMVLVGLGAWAMGAALFDRLSETLPEAV